MQETQFIDETDGLKKLKQEIFAAFDEAELVTEMNDRLEDLKAQGHELVRRVPITHRQALRVAVNQALHGDDRLATKLAGLQHHRKGHR